MEAKIKAIHFDITEELVNFKEASIRLSVPPAADLYASKTADSFEEAVDLCLDALEPQLEKNKVKN